jgi:hypothetical protein
VVTEDDSEDPTYSSGYFEGFFSEEGSLESCGAQVEVVRSSALMHNKFLIIDSGEGTELLLTGSTNFTTNGFEVNHNHIVIVKGVPELIAAYQAEFDQLLTHCTVDRFDSKTCSECTPACTENRSEEGPWMLPGSLGGIQVFFSPSDDALRYLRGEKTSIYQELPDPDCYEPDSRCVCRTSGARWLCDYCSQGPDGFGLLEQANERIMMTMFSATDQCFALGWAEAARRGVSTVGVWDFVKGGSPYSRDDFLCAQGIETYITNWGGGSAQVRNHNKTVIIDNVVFDGSLNLSESGSYKNNENTLVIEDQQTADAFADYIFSEISLLQETGVSPKFTEQCLCVDLVDNDGDGLADSDDPDCDAGDGLPDI